MDPTHSHGEPGLIVEFRPVSRTLNRPLTLCGVDRRMFFLALLAAAGTFNLFYSFLAGCLLFFAIYALAWCVTVLDPQGLQILMRSNHGRPRYDAAKREPPAEARS